MVYDLIKKHQDNFTVKNNFLAQLISKAYNEKRWVKPEY